MAELTEADELIAELTMLLKTFGDTVLFEDWQTALDGEPLQEWSRVKTVELRKRIDAIGPLMRRAQQYQKRRNAG